MGPPDVNFMLLRLGYLRNCDKALLSNQNVTIGGEDGSRRDLIARLAQMS